MYEHPTDSPKVIAAAHIWIAASDAAQAGWHVQNGPLD